MNKWKFVSAPAAIVGIICGIGALIALVKLFGPDLPESEAIRILGVMFLLALISAGAFIFGKE